MIFFLKPKILALFLALTCFVWTGTRALGQSAGDVSKNDILATMKRATDFMVDEVSFKGGFVWNYLPDLSRSWGEMEAYPTMIWTQAPGTPSMGHLFLDAYHATGDEFYYKAAEKAARSLILGQLEEGGWNYIIDFAGDASLKNWYATIGRNGWRLEEFRYYYGNATFDDDATYAPAFFLLRLYLEKYDPVYLGPLQKAITFVLESQYPVGGWPQRYPLKYDHPSSKRPDYTSFITLNDGVHANNVRFLIDCYRALGDDRLLEPIRRAMNCVLLLHQGSPQPGWSWQYTLDLQPAGARTYEPEGIYSGATYHCINLLMDYYEISGETKFLARVPEAIKYLQSLALPEDIADFYPRDLRPGQKVYPSCVERGTNRPLYVHRRGSNAINGEYYADYDPVNQWMPTFSMRAMDPGQLKERFRDLEQRSPEEAIKYSPLSTGHSTPIPPFYYASKAGIEITEVERILEELEKRPYWEGVFAASNPYIGTGPIEVAKGDYSNTQVGDAYDTSPYRFGEDLRGISTREYIANMSKLITYLIFLCDQESGL